MTRLLALFTLCLAGPLFAQSRGTPPPAGSPFFPLKVDNRWVYVTPKNKIITMTVERSELVKRTKRELDQSQSQELNTFLVRIESRELPGSDQAGGSKLGIVKILYEQYVHNDDGIYRMMSAGKDIDPPLKVLSKKIDNDSWTVDSKSEAALKGTFKAVTFTANLPGPTEVIRVSCRDFLVSKERKLDADYWFVKDIGIVKQRVQFRAFYDDAAKASDDPALLPATELMIYLKECKIDGQVRALPSPAEIDAALRQGDPGMTGAIPPGVVPPPVLPIP